MRKKVKFLLLLFAGACIFMPPLLIFTLHAPLSFYGVLFTTQILGWFFIYCYLIYRSVCKGRKPKYPIVPPEGRTDIYLPRTDIPRPIHENARRYPDSRKRKEMKKWEKEREKKTS